MKNFFNIIVVGGGHAGIEAAIIAAKKKMKVLLITNNIENLGALSCNPSIGGDGKSKLVKEINSIGGIMGILADYSGIHYKIINSSKGESVKSVRIQIDRLKYKIFTNKFINLYNNLTVKQETVKSLLIINNSVKGVNTTNNNKYFSEITILTTGTFLNGVIYIGLKKIKGGRFNEKINNNLANQLRDLDFYAGRLKTGTPPRINKNKINFNKIKKQKGDYNPIPTFTNKLNNNFIKQKLCWLTKTNKKTHEIIKNALDKSPIFNKNLSGTSPRYCPSIEDKVYKFYKKNSHNIFLEPESFQSNEYYPNGISTSLPYNIQKKFIKSIKGLENVEITRPGYGIEYDFFDSKKLKKSLESKIIKNLFLAGQINGTTGYEEAAAQGLIAGINAINIIKNKNFINLNKKTSYIYLMINDLIKNGVNEPYRIFNNINNNMSLKKEYNDNEKFIKNNIIYKNKNEVNIFFFKNFIFKKIIEINKKFFYKKNIFNILKEKYIIKIKKDITTYYKYINYVKKYKNLLLIKNKNLKIKDTNYFDLDFLSKELREKLNKIKPKNLQDLTKIPKLNYFLIKKIIKSQFN